MTVMKTSECACEERERELQKEGALPGRSAEGVWALGRETEESERAGGRNAHVMSGRYAEGTRPLSARWCVAPWLLGMHGEASIHPPAAVRLEGETRRKLKYDR